MEWKIYFLSSNIATFHNCLLHTHKQAVLRQAAIKELHNCIAYCWYCTLLYCIWFKFGYRNRGWQNQSNLPKAFVRFTSWISSLLETGLATLHQHNRLFQKDGSGGKYLMIVSIWSPLLPDVLLREGRGASVTIWNRTCKGASGKLDCKTVRIFA